MLMVTLPSSQDEAAGFPTNHKSTCFKIHSQLTHTPIAVFCKSLTNKCLQITCDTQSSVFLLFSQEFNVQKRNQYQVTWNSSTRKCYMKLLPECSGLQYKSQQVECNSHRLHRNALFLNVHNHIKSDHNFISSELVTN